MPTLLVDPENPVPHVSDLVHESFSRILLVKPSSLGDVVHALPVLHGLRSRYPQAKIDWLIAPPFAPLLESHGELTDLILFDRRRFGRLGRSLAVTREFVTFVRELRARRYELVVDLQGLFRTGFLAWASGARVRIGFRNAREGARMFYTHRLAIDDPDMHAVDRNYHVSRLLGFQDVPVEFNLALTESAREGARHLLWDRQRMANSPPTAERIANSEFDILNSTFIVAVVPGARWETKVWPPERFVETIDEIQGGFGVRCVLLGSGDEASLCERIARVCRSKPINLAGRTSVGELAALIELSDLVLCHDSAAMHLAVALKRPLVCLIGPTNPLRTGPYRRAEDVVRLELDCAPCYLRRLSQCPFDHRCMKELDVPTVLVAVERSLARTALRS